MILFTNEDKEKCKAMFNDKVPTKDVQDYLMNKYSCARAKTSNFIKMIRKTMGIYHPQPK